MLGNSKFIDRLRKELKLEIPDDVVFVRTYAGHWQKSSGAFSSYLSSEKDMVFQLGFYEPISQLMKCPNLEVGDSYGSYVECGCKGKCKGVNNGTVVRSDQ